MMRFFLFLLTLVLCVGSIQAQANDRKYQATIQFLEHNSKKWTLEGVKVRCEELGQIEVTGEDGIAVFRGLPIGKVSFEAVLIGYRTAHIVLNVVPNEYFNNVPCYLEKINNNPNPEIHPSPPSPQQVAWDIFYNYKISNRERVKRLIEIRERYPQSSINKTDSIQYFLSKAICPQLQKNKKLWWISGISLSAGIPLSIYAFKNWQSSKADYALYKTIINPGNPGKYSQTSRDEVFARANREQATAILTGVTGGILTALGTYLIRDRIIWRGSIKRAKKALDGDGGASLNCNTIRLNALNEGGLNLGISYKF